jgi:hypothetical protein
MAVEIPAALLRGLRRYLDAPQATVRALHRQPIEGGLSGSALEYWRLRLHRAGERTLLTLVYKRGAVVNGAFLRGAAQREALAFVHLPGRSPIDMPTVVAVDRPRGDLWMLPFPPAKRTSHWLADWEQDDIAQALQDLARLHSAFWNKRGVLDEWPWLARPTTSDAAALAADGLIGLDAIISASAFDQALTPDRIAWLRALALNPAALLDPLNEGPFTLLHGDAGFQNIAITLDGRQRIWYDWQLVAAGPPALDLVTFLHPWAYPGARPALSFAEMLELYLEALSRRGLSLDAGHFQCQLDAALLWRWISQWAPLLGQYRQRLRPEVRSRLYAAFEQLHWPALARWIARRPLLAR